MERKVWYGCGGRLGSQPVWGALLRPPDTPSSPPSLFSTMSFCSSPPCPPSCVFLSVSTIPCQLWPWAHHSPRGRGAHRYRGRRVTSSTCEECMEFLYKRPKRCPGGVLGPHRLSLGIKRYVCPFPTLMAVQAVSSLFPTRTSLLCVCSAHKWMGTGFPPLGHLVGPCGLSGHR